MDDTKKAAALDTIEATTLPDLDVGGVVFSSSDYPTQEAAEAALWELIQSIWREPRERQSARTSVDASVCGDWPDDADGDLLCILQEDGFDFSKPTLIDFTVAFQNWPPPAEAVALLSREYPSLKVYPPDENGDGYLQFEVYALASYELVVNVQAHVAELMALFKGECNSWGIFHDPNDTSATA